MFRQGPVGIGHHVPARLASFKDTPMLHLHNAQISNAAMQKMHMYS